MTPKYATGAAAGYTGGDLGQLVPGQINNIINVRAVFAIDILRGVPVAVQTGLVVGSGLLSPFLNSSTFFLTQFPMTTDRVCMSVMSWSDGISAPWSGWHGVRGHCQGVMTILLAAGVLGSPDVQHNDSTAAC